MLFRPGVVQAITGVKHLVLDRWVRARLVRPQNANQGHGRTRLYSLIELIAIQAGMVYQRQKATAERVQAVVKLIASLGYDKLCEHLAAGRTFPVPGMMLGDDNFVGMMTNPNDGPDDLSPGARELLKKLDLTQVVKYVLKMVTDDETDEELETEVV
jgi:hypothetical protein